MWDEFGIQYTWAYIKINDSGFLADTIQAYIQLFEIYGGILCFIFIYIIVYTYVVSFFFGLISVNNNVTF